MTAVILALLDEIGTMAEGVAACLETMTPVWKHFDVALTCSTTQGCFTCGGQVKAGQHFLPRESVRSVGSPVVLDNQAMDIFQTVDFYEFHIVMWLT